MAFVELKYTTNKASELGGRREEYIAGGQVRGYLLVRGSNDFFTCLYLIM